MLLALLGACIRSRSGRFAAGGCDGGVLVSHSLIADQLGMGASSPMNLVCLNCASADCTCGRLDRLMNFASRTAVQEVVDVASELVLGSIDCAAERASAELEACLC